MRQHRATHMPGAHRCCCAHMRRCVDLGARVRDVKAKQSGTNGTRRRWPHVRLELALLPLGSRRPSEPDPERHAFGTTLLTAQEGRVVRLAFDF